MAGNPRSIRAGSAYVELNVRDKLTNALKKVGRFAGRTAKLIGTSFAAAGALAATGVALAVRSFVSFGSQLDDMSKRTGVSVEALSEFKYAADQTGASIDAFETALKRMQKTISDASKGEKAAVDALHVLRLGYEDLRGLRPEGQFRLIAQRIAAIADPTLRAGAALEIFGRSGTDLLPMISQFEKLRDRARELGLVISSETAAAADDLGDKFDDLKAVSVAASTVIGGALAPAIQAIADAMIRGVKAATDWVRSIAGAINEGDWKGIGEIAVNQFKIAFVGLKDFFRSVWQDAATAWIQSQINAIADAKRLWAGLKGFISGIIENIGDTAVEMKIKRDLDKATDPAEKKRLQADLDYLRDMRQKEKQQRDQSLGEEVNRIEQQRKTELAALDDISKKQKQLDQQRHGEEVAALQARNASILARGASAQAQRQRFDQFASDEDVDRPGSENPLFNEFAGKLADVNTVMKELSDRTFAAARGQFGAANVQGLSGTDRVEAQIADATKKTADNTRRIADAARRGLVYGP